MSEELYPFEVASLANYRNDSKRVSIFADSDAGMANACSVADQVGAHILFAGTPAEGPRRLSEFAAGEAVFVDITRDTGVSLDIFLDQIDMLGRMDRTPVLVNTTPECLDATVARLTAPSISLMCRAEMSDWVAMLAVNGITPATVMHDIALDDTIRLQRLADEVQRIAQTLANLVGDTPQATAGVSDAMIGYRADVVRYDAKGDPIAASEIRAIIRLRRLRERYFRTDLFADPAWDMLLDLMAARIERIQVAVSSLCIAAAVPPTTALRWIKTLSDNGMFVRLDDPNDGRRVYIELSDAAAAGMTAYLTAARATGGLAV